MNKFYPQCGSRADALKGGTEYRIIAKATYDQMIGEWDCELEIIETSVYEGVDK